MRIPALIATLAWLSSAQLTDSQCDVELFEDTILVFAFERALFMINGTLVNMNVLNERIDKAVDKATNKDYWNLPEMCKKGTLRLFHTKFFREFIMHCMQTDGELFGYQQTVRGPTEQIKVKMEGYLTVPEMTFTGNSKCDDICNLKSAYFNTEENQLKFSSGGGQITYGKYHPVSPPPSGTIKCGQTTGCKSEFEQVADWYEPIIEKAEEANIYMNQYRKDTFILQAEEVQENEATYIYHVLRRKNPNLSTTWIRCWIRKFKKGGEETPRMLLIPREVGARGRGVQLVEANEDQEKPEFMKAKKKKEKKDPGRNKGGEDYEGPERSGPGKGAPDYDDDSSTPKDSKASIVVLAIVFLLLFI